MTSTSAAARIVRAQTRDGSIRPHLASETSAHAQAQAHALPARCMDAEVGLALGVRRFAG
jgi:hypothetical protein